MLRPTSSGPTVPTTKSECPSTPIPSSPSVEPPVKKTKIWSIAETVGCSNDSDNKTDSADSQPVAPASVQNLFNFASPNFPFPPWNSFLPTIHPNRPPLFPQLPPHLNSAGFLSCLQVRPTIPDLTTTTITTTTPGSSNTTSVPKTTASDAGEL